MQSLLIYCIIHTILTILIIIIMIIANTNCVISYTYIYIIKYVCIPLFIPLCIHLGIL